AVPRALLRRLRREPADPAAAAALGRASGRTPAECAAWSARAQRRGGLLLAMTDAAEGRRPPGPGTTLLALVYDQVYPRVVEAPIYPLSRRPETRLLAAGAAALVLALAVAGLGLSRRARRAAGPRPPAAPG